MRGFSLVELSIVLVILGLLTGGILAGQNLIRAAELRSVSTDIDKMTAAVYTFRDKYFALPGDMRNATQFWGRASSATHCVTNSAAAVDATGSCDGDGDGIVEDPAAASQNGERYHLWRQLTNAGLIEGNYTGVAGTGGPGHTTADNSPKSKISIALYTMATGGAVSGHSAIFDRTITGLAIQFGGAHASAGNRVPVLTPEECWNIDTKKDDGKPAQGKVLARTDESTYGLADFATSATSSDLDADYLLTSSIKTCALHFYIGR